MAINIPIPVGIDSVGADLFYAPFPAEGQEPKWIEVPLITKIVPPQVDVKTIKATAINQGDRWERYVIGMTEGGEVQFSCIYQAAVYQALDAIGGFGYYWKMVLPDQSYVQFTGILTKLHASQLSTSENEAVTLECTVKVAAAAAIFANVPAA